MWNWIKGTVRPIALLAGFPVVIGALLGHVHLGWDIVYAIGSAMLGVGFANAFNSLVDRHIDRLNPAKKFLAQVSPVAAWYGVLFLLPPLAFFLRSNSYNHRLFAIVYFTSFIYSYALGRVRVVKRIVVAACIAATAFLYVPTPNLAVWLFAGLACVCFYIRERHKDQQDKVEDNAVRFNWSFRRLDLWYITAPLSAVAIYLLSLTTAGNRIDLTEAVICFGIALSVWSYIQIRYRYRWYKMPLVHQVTSGRLGAVIALVGLMPSFVNPAFILVVLWNVATIEHRSFLTRAFAVERLAVLHDSWLWASLPVLAMTKVGCRPELMVASLAIGCIVYYRERSRIGSLLQVA